MNTEQLEAFRLAQSRTTLYAAMGNPIDDLHLGLDLAGNIPVFGELFDGMNGLLYAGRGQKINAAASFSAMAPIVGNGLKLGVKGLAPEIIKQTNKKVDLLFANKNEAMNWARKQLGHNTEKMYDINGKWIGWNSSKGSVYWGHGDWGKGVGSSTFPHLNYK